MIEVPCPPEQVVVVGDFHFYTPEELFSHWVTPAQVTQWWPQEATIDAQVGGRYTFTWPDMDWVLSGEYTSFRFGRHLGFTWSWSHDRTKDQPLQVDVFFKEIENGTRMSVFHGPFEDDDQERQGVLEGWIHFGMRLAGLRRADPDPVP